MPCTKCELHRLCRTKGLDGYGPNNPEILFVGQDPNIEEDRSSKSGIGKTWEAIKNTLSSLGIDPSQCRYTHIVRCHVPGDNTISPAHLSACYEHLEKEVLGVNPKVIVFLGALSVKEGLKSREKLTSLRGGRPLKATIGEKEFDAFVTYSPGQVFRQPSLATDLVADLHAVKEFLSGNLRADNLLTIPITTEAELANLVDHIKKERPLTAFDLETTSVYRFRPGSRVLCLGLCFDPEFAYVIPYQYGYPGDGEDWGEEAVLSWMEISLPYLKQIFEDPKIPKFGHNVQFDTTYPETAMGMYPKGIVDDTMLLHYLCNERVGTHGLEHLASMVGHAGYDSAIGPYYPDRMHLAPWEELYTYNGADCIVTYKLYELLYPQVSGNKNLRRVHDEILIPGLDHLADLTRNGVYIDQTILEEVKLQLDTDIATLRDTIGTLDCVQAFGNSYRPLLEKERAERASAKAKKEVEGADDGSN